MNHYQTKNLPDPMSIREAASKLYIDSNFTEPNLMKFSAHVDFNDKNLDKVRLLKVNSLPAVS